MLKAKLNLVRRRYRNFSPRQGLVNIGSSILEAPELVFLTNIGCTLELESKQLQLCKNEWRRKFAEGGNSKHTKKNNAQSKNSARIFVCLTLWWFGATEVSAPLLVAMHLHPTKSSSWPCLVTCVASEFRSSQTSTCHHCCVKSVKRQGQKQRATVLQCLGCATLHSRDFNAARVIADVFLDMQATHSSGLPDWITVDAIRQSNLLIPLAV
jgi:hypothetical protein